MQKRHVLLIGDPGTGKSMLAQSMVDFLPKEELEDIVVFPNPEDNNKPKIKTHPIVRWGLKTTRLEGIVSYITKKGTAVGSR